MTFTSTRRFCGGALVVAALICLSSCAVPLAPGYQIEKQSITVRFVPGAPPHLAIRAQYRLANVGTAPLDSIELALPSAQGFGLANLRVKIDGREVTPQRERSETSAPAEGETAAAETWPETWRIPFESRWSRRARKNLVLEYDLAATSATDPRISIATNAFYLNDSGWFPGPISTKALFAKNVVRPDPSDLIVDVPANFVATASGETRAAHKASGETEFRFLLHRDDFDPYVVAGAYQQQKFVTPDGDVIFWTFESVPTQQEQTRAARLASAKKIYEATFGPLPGSAKGIVVVQMSFTPNEPTKAGPFGGTLLPNIILEFAALHPRSFGAAPLPHSLRLDLASMWFIQSIRPRPEAWLLAGALSAYALSLTSESAGDQVVRALAVRDLLNDYDEERAKAVEKPVAFLTPDEPAGPQRIGGDKSVLFFAALEDKCGAENLRHAIAHMVYALRGQEYGYNDFRAALEQECHQDLANFFDIWLNHTGIPPDFRARYDKSNSMKSVDGRPSQ